jgi:hypothetical protein
MKRWIVVLIVFLSLAGCKGMKESQLGAYVGDTQTKIVYKNVGGAVNKIPQARRQYFRGVDEASSAGFTLSNEATPGTTGGQDE